MEQFEPPRLLRNHHLQSIVSSSPPRIWWLRAHGRRLSRTALDVILDCHDGIRLHGLYNAHSQQADGLVVLIHGWEGSATSSHQLSSAIALFEAGFDVFRLHLRDHGPSHHLNAELFNSTRLQEVVDAIHQVQQRYPHKSHYLAGLSLGGNFALRVAARAPAASIKLERVVGICPVLDPVHTMQILEHESPIYHRYFVRRWKRSLRTKLIHYPELGYQGSLMAMNSLSKMNAFFVPRYTGFDTPVDYFRAYALTGDTLARLQVPCQLIASRDDPIIPIADLDKVARPPALSVEITEYGGHCGFLMDYRLRSWLDQRLITLFGG